MDNTRTETTLESPQTPTPQDTAPEVKRTTPLAWLARLYFRPEKFFHNNIQTASLILTLLCVSLMSGVIPLTHYIGNLTSFPRIESILGLVGLTAFIAILWYFLGGSWYGIRLLMCKPNAKDWTLTRRIFMFSEITYLLPLVIGLSIFGIWQNRACLLIVMATIALFMFWSLYISYRGARTLFQVDKFRAVVWLIIIPAMFYGILASILAVKINVASRQEERTQTPLEIAAIKLEYPSNWIRLETPSPDNTVAFHIPDIGSFAATVIVPNRSNIDLQQVAINTSKSVAEKNNSSAIRPECFTKWGGYTGHGVRFLMSTKEKNSFGRIFLASLPDGQILMIEEMGVENAIAQLEKQYQIVRDSLVVKPPK